MDKTLLKEFPSLIKSYKGMFPFKLATTSYIFPDHIIPNVIRLAPFLDEIELVLFESEELDNYPDGDQMKDLMTLSIHQGVDFNVHLPIDIFLGDENEEVRSQGISIVKKIIGRTLYLNVSTYTLHFDLRDRSGREETDIQTWRRRIIQSGEEILGNRIEPSRISIETLGYPFEWIEDIVKEFGFSICLDIGHILFYGQDLPFYLGKYLPHTSIIHLHGFQNGTDHLGIDKLNGKIVDLILSHLQNYKGTLSLEVFSFNDLKSSLEILEEKWGRR
jgi:sugar phosphate isomerase/epimerase